MLAAMNARLYNKVEISYYAYNVSNNSYIMLQRTRYVRIYKA